MRINKYTRNRKREFVETLELDEAVRKVAKNLCFCATDGQKQGIRERLEAGEEVETYGYVYVKADINGDMLK